MTARCTSIERSVFCYKQAIFGMCTQLVLRAQFSREAQSSSSKDNEKSMIPHDGSCFFLTPLKGAHSENLIVFLILRTVLPDDHSFTPVSAV